MLDLYEGVLEEFVSTERFRDRSAEIRHFEWATRRVEETREYMRIYDRQPKRVEYKNAWRRKKRASVRIQRESHQ